MLILIIISLANDICIIKNIIIILVKQRQNIIVYGDTVATLLILLPSLVVLFSTTFLRFFRSPGNYCNAHNHTKVNMNYSRCLYSIMDKVMKKKVKKMEGGGIISFV